MPDRELTESERDWLRVRRHLVGRRYELGVQAAAQYPGHITVAGTPLLSRPAWVPQNPIPLSDIELRFAPETPFAGIRGDDPSAAGVLPVRPDGTRYRTYSAAMAELAAPAVFQDRGTYRLLEADLTADTPFMAFGRGSYFDGIDVGESVAHEYAAADLHGRAVGGWRAAIGDPCDPHRRATNIAISTLTVRHDRATGEATFLVHWRDPAKVGHAGGLYQVIPVGVFQASGDQPWNETNDFSLWRGMIREFAEELLGGSEDYGTESAPIDYHRLPLARRLDDILERGKAEAVLLGLGADPLTLAVDALTAVVLDASEFDNVFGDLVTGNSEGSVDAAHPLTDDEVRRFVRRERMQAAGAAALALFWQTFGTPIGR
ncbi:helix-turn-helix domain-containing protein [Pseudonocardia bannensis]|uniref:Transcriptional regulator n=1 Tax=Pseudonocardia bannensis TaxID=630973 RepID=A0A848DP13_9PSEU|nr:transcriptional regulator [Pseudonocardia bannensis]NMH94468.1 transcriptional regulator [Pseudonocardia bannensis]